MDDIFFFRMVIWFFLFISFIRDLMMVRKKIKTSKIFAAICLKLYLVTAESIAPEMLILNR